MSEDQKLTSFGFDSQELKEEVKSDFKINDTPIFKFEDKKGYNIEVMTNLKIEQAETKFGIKYYIPILINKEAYYWQASAKSLREILAGVEEGAKEFTVMLNTADKAYSIIPKIEVK